MSSCTQLWYVRYDFEELMNAISSMRSQIVELWGYFCYLLAWRLNEAWASSQRAAVCLSLDGGSLRRRKWGEQRPDAGEESETKEKRVSCAGFCRSSTMLNYGTIGYTLISFLIMNSKLLTSGENFAVALFVAEATRIPEYALTKSKNNPGAFPQRCMLAFPLGFEYFPIWERFLFLPTNGCVQLLRKLYNTIHYTTLPIRIANPCTKTFHFLF